MPQSKRRQAIDDLPNAELEVLAYVRQSGGATTREVSEGLAPHRRMGMSAAQALLLRLEAKGLLRREPIRGTKAFRYKPTDLAAPTHRRIARRFVKRVFGGSPTMLMASLFDGEPPCEQEIRKLRQMLREFKRKK